MNLNQIDIAIRLGAATTVLLLAWLLFARRREIGTPAWLFTPLALCLAGFVVGNTPEAALRPSGLLGVVANLASGFTVVFLWWFCLSCFENRFRLHGGVLATGLLWAAVAGADRSLLGLGLADGELSYVLIAMGYGVVIHLIWRLLAERRGDLINRRHDARIMVSLLLGGLLLIDLSIDLLLGLTWRPLAFSMSQNAAVLGFGVWLAGQVLAVRPDALTFGVQATPSPVVPAQISVSPHDKLQQRLSILIDAERVHLDPGLTFAAFVRRMGAPERTVRKFVNDQLGFDHFRTFLNHHRMAEARRRLADPGCADDKLIAVAMDSGFASLASFNRVFQAVEGCSPSRFRAAALANRPASGSEKPHAGF